MGIETMPAGGLGEQAPEARLDSNLDNGNTKILPPIEEIWDSPQRITPTERLSDLISPTEDGWEEIYDEE